MKKNRAGGSSQDRRRARRASERAVQPAADPAEDFDAIAALAAGASITEPLEEFEASVENDEAAILELAARARGPELSLWDRRQAVRSDLVASGASTPALVTNYEMTMGSLAERWFVQAAIEAGYVELSGDSWPCDLDSLSNEEDDRVTFRSGTNDAVYRLADGTIAHVKLSYGTLRMHTAAPTREAATEVCAAFRALFPASYLIDDGDTRVPITFWTLGSFGPVPRLRKIEAAKWEEIEGNYSGDIRHQIGSMMGWKEPESDGQLILWQGEPGTGKTWALRALASEWASWAEFHYITDPDAFFIKDPSYMIDVLLSDSYGAIDIDTGDVYDETDPMGKWRVLILEDTGELLAANAKESYGQGLSRLLNVVDGMIGQGLRVLCLVTTNDELGDLHPAAARPGRCAVQAEFGPLSAEEASEWLEGEEVSSPMTLAELYAHRETGVEAFAQEMPCATCDHAFDMHDGACTVEGCSCMAYEAPDEMAVVDPEPEEASDLMAAAVPRSVTFNLVFDDDTVERAATVLADGVKLERVSDGEDPHARVSFDERLSAALSSKFADAGLGDLPVLPDAHSPGESLPAPNPSPAAPEVAAQASGFEWTAMFVPEATLTDDGRAFAPGSLTWRELPLTLMGLNETGPGGHEGAIACGRIDNVWRDGHQIRATGVFSEDEVGTYFATNVGDGTIRGLSIDIAIHEYEVGPKTDYFDEEGNWRAEKLEAEAPPERDLLDVLFGGEQEDTIFVVTDGVIGAATVCPFPAFAEANISLAASGAIWTYQHQGAFTVVDKRAGSLVASGLEAPVVPLFTVENAETDDEGLTASAAGLVPVHPPVEWFDDPELTELTPITVDENGRIFGHAWAWDTCHTAFPDVCTVAPHSDAEYAYFLLKTVECDDGQEVEVGTITLDTGHAGQRATRENAVAHYDNTGCAVADVVVGEDAFGGWVSGALRPHVDAAQARKLKGSVLSGDWRNVDGNLELVALLAVNVPGFPVPRTRALVATGIGERSEVLSLVAAGMNAALVPESILAEIEALADVARGRFSEIARRARAA